MSARSATGRAFACRDQPHAFDAPPHSWATFREPQITAGIAYFLQQGPFARRRERVRQFLACAFEAAGAEELKRRIEAADLTATEAIAEEARVDLIVQATTVSKGNIGLVVEAKFGHHLTRGQLPAARRHASGRGLGTDNAAFLVVLPHRSDVGTRIFSRPANSQWRAVSWWTLLVGLESRITPEADDVAYRSLRHTIWQQTYG